MPTSETVTEHLGHMLGALLAPFFTLTSELRHARTFHPRGDLAEAVAHTHASVAEGDRGLALLLEGPVLLRFSDALSKGKARWPDVLGCALRFGAGADHTFGAQDLLFATIRSPWTMPFAPFATRVCDYLGNDYFAVSPFDAPGHERVYFRLHPLETADTASPRAGNAPERRRGALREAVDDARAILELGVSEGSRGTFRPLVVVTLLRVAKDQPRDLHFNAFRSGRGIEPRGFVHAIRKRVYAASQVGRAIAGEPA